VSPKLSRRRWQIEIRPEDEEAVDFLREAFGAKNESQAGRNLLGFWKRVVDASRAGQLIVESS